MELALEDIKMYLKIDGYEEDSLLEHLKSSAECYLEEAGIKINYKKGTYRLCVLMLIQHYYTNRSPIVEGTKYVEEIPFGIRGFIQQLQLGGLNENK